MVNKILIVGAGIYGATAASILHKAGKQVHIIEKNKFIGGNCHTKNVNGIEVHEFGPHIFHTSNKVVWEFVNKFGEFNNFVNRPKVNFQGNIYSFPINLMTMYQIFGCRTPNDAKSVLNKERIPYTDPQNLEEWILSQVGPKLYETFIRGYTLKQWGKHPRNLPTSIIKRLPIRFTYDDNYFNDIYQGIPINGYTDLISNMISPISRETEVDYLKNKSSFESKYDLILYTGQIDKYFDYQFGDLEYRSLHFQHNPMDNIDDFQGNAVVNYTAHHIPFTRVVEHKHFYPERLKYTRETVVTYETPQLHTRETIPYYPIRDKKNIVLYNKYKEFAEKEEGKVIFCGRLGSYVYIDMHQAVAMAMQLADKIIRGDLS